MLYIVKESSNLKNKQN